MRRTRNRAKTALTIGTLAIGMAFGVAGFGASALADGPRGHGKGPQASYNQGYGGKAGYHGKKQYRAQKRAYKKGYRQGYKQAYKAQKHAYRKGYRHGYKDPYRKDGHYGHRHGPYYKGPAFGFFFGHPARTFGPAPVQRGAYKYDGRRYCHPVSKVGYDAYGRRVKFGGTMCYDRYGASYIVRGSKHIIHYY